MSVKSHNINRIANYTCHFPIVYILHVNIHETCAFSLHLAFTIVLGNIPFNIDVLHLYLIKMFV